MGVSSVTMGIVRTVIKHQKVTPQSTVHFYLILLRLLMPIVSCCCRGRWLSSASPAEDTSTCYAQPAEACARCFQRTLYKFRGHADGV